MTTVVFNSQHEIEIKNNGRVVIIPIANFCAIDGELHECAARAQHNPGTEVPVPDKSFARGLRPRNYGAYGVRQ